MIRLEKAKSIIIGLLIYFAGYIGLDLLIGKVLQDLINWFISPIFLNGALISYWMAFGISIFIGAITMPIIVRLEDIKNNTDNGYKSSGKTLTINVSLLLSEIIAILMSWGLGAIVSNWV